MTIIEKLIEEVSSAERGISKAVESGTISKRASQVLADECIKLLVAIQGNQVIASLMQPQAREEQLIAMPHAGQVVVKN